MLHPQISSYFSKSNPYNYQIELAMSIRFFDAECAKKRGGRGGRKAQSLLHVLGDFAVKKNALQRVATFRSPDRLLARCIFRAAGSRRSSFESVWSIARPGFRRESCAPSPPTRIPPFPRPGLELEGIHVSFREQCEIDPAGV